MYYVNEVTQDNADAPCWLFFEILKGLPKEKNVVFLLLLKHTLKKKQRTNKQPKSHKQEQKQDRANISKDSNVKTGRLLYRFAS